METGTGLRFEESISRNTRVLVVNPVNTYWSYFLTAETTARAAKKSDYVTWINLACRQKRRFEVNAGDNLPIWRFRDTARALRKVFESLNVSFDIAYTKLSKFDAPPEFESIEELRDFKMGEMRIGALIFSGISSAMKSTAFTLDEAEPYINHYFRYASSSIKRLRQTIAEVNPDLILTTNDRLISSSAAIAIAAELKIPSRVIYWGSSMHNLQDYAVSLYDSDEWQANINSNWEKNAPLQEDLDKLKHDIEILASVPSKDSMSYLTKQKSGKNLPITSKTAVFYAQSEHEHSPNFIVSDNRRFQTQYEAFVALQKASKDCGWSLILKYHPRKEGLVGLQGISNPNFDWGKVTKLNHVIEIPCDSDIDTYKLMEDCDLNVVWSSTVGLESISRELPTLILGNPHWLNKDWSIHAWTECEIQSFFRKEIEPIAKESLLPWFWYLFHYGSESKYFRLLRGSFTYMGNKLVVERPIFAVAVEFIQFLVRLARRGKF